MYAAVYCDIRQEMQVALSGKHQEVDLLRAEVDDLSTVFYWPADVECLTAQLTGLDDQCTSLEIKVCDILWLLLMLLFCNCLSYLNCRSLVL